MLGITRDLASGSTDSPIMQITQDNTGDDQVCLTLKQDATTGSTKILSLLGASAAEKFSVDIEGDAILASTLTVNGSTNGAIAVSPIASGTGTTTIQNQVGTPTITLPAATCTLPGLGLANTFSAKNTFSGEVKADQVTEDKLFWQDEFMEAAAVLASTVYSKAHWTGAGTSGTQTIAAAPGGVMNLETTNTGSRTATLTFTTANFDAADIPCFETRLKTSNITNSKIEFGMYVDANDEILFRFDTAVNAGNIYLVTESNNAGEIVTDTTVDLVAGAYATFRIEWLTTTTFKVYINGTEVLASHSSNVIRSLATFKPYFYVDNKDQAEAKILSVDYVKMWQNRDT